MTKEAAFTRDEGIGHAIHHLTVLHALIERLAGPENASEGYRRYVESEHEDCLTEDLGWDLMVAARQVAQGSWYFLREHVWSESTGDEDREAIDAAERGWKLMAVVTAALRGVSHRTPTDPHHMHVLYALYGLVDEELARVKALVEEEGASTPDVPTVDTSPDEPSPRWRGMRLEAAAPVILNRLLPLIEEAAEWSVDTYGREDERSVVYLYGALQGIVRTWATEHGLDAGELDGACAELLQETVDARGDVGAFIRGLVDVEASHA